MTQQPNEQQDALVTKVRDAIIRAWHDPEFYKNHDLLAQAALAAVREEHVVVPIDLANAVLGRLLEAGYFNRAYELEEYMVQGEPHGRASRVCDAGGEP